MLVAHLGFNCSALTENFFISGLKFNSEAMAKGTDFFYAWYTYLGYRPLVLTCQGQFLSI